MPTKTRASSLTADEYRAILGDTKKEIKVDVAITFLNGSLDRFRKKCERVVKDSEIEGDWKLKFIPAKNGYYSYSYRNDPAKIQIVGYRPYTDDEIIKNGARLVAAKAKQEAKDERERAKNVEKYNALAEKLGVDPIKED